MKTALKVLLTLIATGYPLAAFASLLGVPTPSFLPSAEDGLALFTGAAIVLLALIDYSKPVDALPLPVHAYRSGKTEVPFSESEKNNDIAA